MSARARGLFVTGTDTEVGKTAISCALLEVAAAAGLRTAAVKPARTRNAVTRASSTAPSSDRQAQRAV